MPQPLASPHLRGHLLLFDPRPLPTLGAGAGGRLLLAAALLEGGRLAAVTWLLPVLPLWALLPILLAGALLALRFGTGLDWPALGLRRWGDWTTTETSYFLQVLVLANVVFPAVLAGPLRDRLAQSTAMAVLTTAFLPYLAYGFYQEVVYRGMVQRDLERRWGAAPGILVANALYTFGPLHWNYFSSRPALAVPMLAATFVMGLFFGLLFKRSGNLWLPAVFHALGNAYVVTALGSVG